MIQNIFCYIQNSKLLPPFHIDISFSLETLIHNVFSIFVDIVSTCQDSRNSRLSICSQCDKVVHILRSNGTIIVAILNIQRRVKCFSCNKSITQPMTF